MKVRKNTLYTIGIVLILFSFGFLFLSQGESNLVTGNSILENAGNVQIVKMYVENGKYIITPSEFKRGDIVRIEADMSKMPGCSKSIVISAFNIRKTLTNTNNVIEFKAEKAGTFNIVCSMNMYKGVFTILEYDGSKSNFVEQASSGGHSCGGSGGGCGGCGG
ncbi:cupredoxin domain-containing protein [Candidatus Pacearchaeota archaeon]|nr:cupredoxin domain-containing protein [Candidatus Pacearchaeota archaeon]